MNEAIINFDEIHEAYRPKIRRYLARMVGEDEAEDLTQEVFVKVHRALEGFKGESTFSTWIYRIATNAALDKLRSPSFHRAGECVPLTEDADLQESAAVEKKAVAEREESSPERQVFLREGLECYRGILNGLPINYRAVVALSELGDLAVEEIAKILGLSPATVKIRLHRGREKLLRELKAHCRAEDWL
jgi:RNA polymerase sigma-70 factor (ECF subfamily)